MSETVLWYTFGMRAGEASMTARRVAAQRLTFPRVPAPYGEPEGDDRLARDVAGDIDGSTGLMRDYLAARTRFFDAVVVRAIDNGISQVVIGAAGYDGRAFRYAKPGVRWFEIDHPATHADKLRRLDGLGIAHAHVSYVAADFAAGPFADALVATGVDADAAALFALEGVAIYLEQATLEFVLGQLRSVAGPGSRLAISLSVSGPNGQRAARRMAFRTAVARMGEPARTTLTADGAQSVLAATGWRRVQDRSDNAERRWAAGLVLVEPV